MLTDEQYWEDEMREEGRLADIGESDEQYCLDCGTILTEYEMSQNRDTCLDCDPEDEDDLLDED